MEKSTATMLTNNQLVPVDNHVFHPFHHTTKKTAPTPTPPNSTPKHQLQAEGADESLQGWAYWTYKSFDDVTTQNQHTETFYNDDGSLQVEVGQIASKQGLFVDFYFKTRCTPFIRIEAFVLKRQEDRLCVKWSVLMLSVNFRPLVISVKSPPPPPPPPPSPLPPLAATPGRKSQGFGPHLRPRHRR